MKGMNLRDVNADVTHHVIDALEARPHLINCDHKAKIFLIIFVNNMELVY